MKEHTWNCRVMKHVSENGDISYALHEVHYEDGKIYAWTNDPMCGHFESVEDLVGYLKLMLRDAVKCRNDLLDYEMEPEVVLEDEPVPEIPKHFGKQFCQRQIYLDEVQDWWVCIDRYLDPDNPRTEEESVCPFRKDEIGIRAQCPDFVPFEK